MRPQVYQIAIDGPTASGKGTVAKMLARKFGFLCLDTGALYRGITVYFLDNNVDIADAVSINRALSELDLDVKCIEGNTLVFLNGTDITGRLRLNEVSTRVFFIAKIPEVRARVRKIQAQVAEKSTLVCEGRDVTSVVFPEALFKFYLTASIKERADRRFRELKSRGEDIRLEKLIDEIAARDKADMTREKSPLVHVKDAVLIDATHQSPYNVVKRMERVITKRLMRLS